MLAFDEPSYDGRWNLDYNTSTWFSPYELNPDNGVDKVFGSGWDFLYAHELRDVIKKHERRRL